MSDNYSRGHYYDSTRRFDMTIRTPYRKRAAEFLKETRTSHVIEYIKITRKWHPWRLKVTPEQWSC